MLLTHVNVSVVLFVDVLLRVGNGARDSVLHFQLQLPELSEKLGGVLRHGMDGFLQIVVFLKNNVIDRIWTCILLTVFEKKICSNYCYCNQ